MIDLLTLEPAEAERIAYAEGFTLAAELFARIDELTRERDALQEELDDLPSKAQRNQDAQDLEQLKQFFSDCFEHLDGRYPCPEYCSDYDKNVIFEAIERGEAA